MDNHSAAVAQPPAASFRAKQLALVGIAVGSFMAALDSSIAHTLLPEMGRRLHTDVATIEWVLTVYLLVVSGALPAFGRLGDMRGHKDTYVIGFAGFIVASLLCGLAPTAGWLIFFRVLQALTASMLYANAPAILSITFPASERGRALGMQVAATYVGYSLGPPLGGLLAVYWGWRAIFFINVPIGAIGLYLSYKLIFRDRPVEKAPAFDWLGAALFFLGLLSLLLALNQGYHWGWGAPKTLSLLAAGVALLVWFVFVEGRQPHPMLDLSLFRHPVFSGAVFSAIMCYVANSSIYFLLAFYLIGARALNPAQAGMVIMAQPIVIMLLVPFTGRLSDRINARLLAVAGMVLIIVGLVLLSLATAPVPLWYVSAALVICGVGFGFFIVPNNSRLLGAAPRNRQGIASGLLSCARTLGMVMGVAISGAVYTTVLHRVGPSGITHAVSMGLHVVAVLAAVAIVTTLLEPGAPAAG